MASGAASISPTADLEVMHLAIVGGLPLGGTHDTCIEKARPSVSSGGRRRFTGSTSAICADVRRRGKS